MKKYLFLSIAFLFAVLLAHTQTDKAKYPEPEFSNEICFLKKDNVNTLVRLEKNYSKMDTKMKIGGLGGFENGYTIEGEGSTTRFNSGPGLSFIYATSSTTGTSLAQSDSIMRAQGVDPEMMKQFQNMSDPSKTISLYRIDNDKGKRKIYLMKSGAPIPFGSKKNKSSDKIPLSVRKVRDGYWELIIDKTLPRGEYGFVISGMGSESMDGSITIFCFGIDQHNN